MNRELPAIDRPVMPDGYGVPTDSSGLLEWACTLHLEDGTHAVIVEGTSGPTTPPGPQRGGRLSTAFGKYKDKGYAPPPDSWEGELAGGLCRFVPATALAWFNFPIDVTRFRWS